MRRQNGVNIRLWLYKFFDPIYDFFFNLEKFGICDVLKKKSCIRPWGAGWNKRKFHRNTCRNSSKALVSLGRPQQLEFIWFFLNAISSILHMRILSLRSVSTAEIPLWMRRYRLKEIQKVNFCLMVHQQNNFSRKIT